MSGPVLSDLFSSRRFQSPSLFFPSLAPTRSFLILPCLPVLPAPSAPQFNSIQFNCSFLFKSTTSKSSTLTTREKKKRICLSFFIPHPHPPSHLHRRLLHHQICSSSSSSSTDQGALTKSPATIAISPRHPISPATLRLRPVQRPGLPTRSAQPPPGSKHQNNTNSTSFGLRLPLLVLPWPATPSCHRPLDELSSARLLGRNVQDPFASLFSVLKIARSLLRCRDKQPAHFIVSDGRNRAPPPVDRLVATTTHHCRPHGHSLTNLTGARLTANNP